MRYMSTTRLLVLGLVRWVQPVHGYDIRRELLSWGVADWANVAPGSIYHALKKLTNEGLLEAAEPEAVGRRPARTPYRITAAGEREFQDLLRKYWWDYKMPLDPFAAAWSFLPAMDPKEAAAALRSRARTLGAECDRWRSLAATLEVDPGTPPHVPELMRLWTARAEAEITWCQSVAELAEQGKLHDWEGKRRRMSKSSNQI